MLMITAMADDINAHDKDARVDYAKRCSPSKGRWFRGYKDPQGKYHDIG